MAVPARLPQGGRGVSRVTTMEIKNVSKRALAKAIDPEQKTIEGYASTFGWDRDDERFVRGAWDLGGYLKNPVVLWSHDLTQPPIARNAGITEDEHGLKTVTQFNPDDARSMEYFGLYEKGFLNAFSVGFIRKNYQMAQIEGTDRKGLEVTEAELFEYSAVSVPANPGALITRDLAEMAMKLIGQNSVEQVLTKSNGGDPLFLVVPEDKRKEIQPPVEGDGFEPALQKVIELARIAKGSAMPDSRKSLVMTALSVFNEMLDAGEKQLTQEDMLKLGSALAEFGTVAANLYPEAAPIISKTISQVGKALEARRE